MDSKNKYVDNTPINFISDLGQSINIGNAICSLVDVRFPDTRRNKKDIYIFSDICESSIVCGRYLPLLRIIGENVNLHTPFYVPMSFKEINSIHIYAKQLNDDGQLIEASFQPDTFRCTLHIDCLQ